MCARSAAQGKVPAEGRCSARTGQIPRQHKNGEYAAVTRRRPAFQQHEAYAEGSDTTPMQERRKKCKTGVFYHLPQQGSRRNPEKRFRREEDEQQRERVLPLAAGRGICRPLGRRRGICRPLGRRRGICRPLGRRPASHLSGLRRSRCPAKCTERAKTCTQIPGGSPDPLLATIGEKYEKRY